MKKMKRLELDRIDLEELCHALEDHSDLSSWFIDSRTGKLHLFSDSMWDGEDVGRDFEPPDDCHRIEPLDSRESYQDLAEFTAMVRDPKTRDLLERAIAGRGAFRRFKDVLAEFPELRAAWFKFHDARLERRAIEWLRDEGLVTEAEADRAVAARPDPDQPEIGGPFDAQAIARAVADDLKGLYGKRLRKVLLYGSWARGDARPDSDIDLLIVLDRVDDRFQERHVMSEILYKHSLANDTVVSGLPVAESDFADSQRPVIVNARREGYAVV
jgi:hypothetical protein